MKIAITGHTSGIGLALFEHFQSSGHTCIGFSRSNGHDISKSIDRGRILLASLDADVFINNAYNNWDNSQYLMLEKVAAQWAGREKLIINSASKITDYEKPKYDFLQKYRDTKILLDNFTKMHQGLPYISNLKFGWVDTPRVTNSLEEKMSLEAVVKTVDFVVQNKGILNIKSLTLVK
jgi:NAD(P)-dependent dehydrogenase (short-subunit alcohol dehydrogenase family)